MGDENKSGLLLSTTIVEDQKPNSSLDRHIYT